MDVRLHRIRFIPIIGGVLGFFLLLSGAVVVKTPAEAVNYIQYSQHEEIDRFLSYVDSLSPEMTVQIVGRTLPLRNFSVKDLSLCIITEEGAACPEELNRAKPTFYVVAAKHGNEQSAKEAALWLIRDLTVGELKPLLSQVNFLILPTANPYGNWFDQRQNEQGLDLNRDQVKLESPEAEAINHVFYTWMPEVTLDVHEKGDDFYRVSIGCVSNANIHKSLQTYSRNVLLAEVEEKLVKKKITFHEYLISQVMGIDSSAGVTYAPGDVEIRENMMRYSTSDLNDGRNSPGIYETLSFIQEGASRHDLKTLEERTRYQYYGIRSLAESVGKHGEEIVLLVRGLRKTLLEKARVYSEDDVVHLRMRYAREEKQPTLTIKKFERTSSPVRGILKVDKKAGEILTAADIERLSLPAGGKVFEEVVKNWFPNVEPLISVTRPLGYIIPAKYKDVTDTLLKHGLKLHFFLNDFPLEAEAYQVIDIIPAKYDYLAPQKIEVENKTIKAITKKGDIYISCIQPGANLIPCLLEPQSQYGLIRYWAYKLVPEKGEVFPFYRVVLPKDLPLVPLKSWKK